MKKSTLWFGLAACSAMLLVGCGGGESAAKQSEPAVLDGSVAAIRCDYRMDAKRPAFQKIAETTLALLKDLPKEAEVLKGIIEKNVKAVGTPDGVQWCALSVGEVEMPGEKGIVIPDIAFALAAKRSLELEAEVKKLVKEQGGKEVEDAFAVEDADIAGCKACRLVLKGEAKKELDDNKVANLSLCWAWLNNDSLLLAASNEKTLAALIALYRDGKGASAKFAFDKSMLSFVLPEPGKQVAKFASDDDLKAVPGGAKVAKGLTDLRLSYGFSADGNNLDVRLSVQTGDEKVAKDLRDQANGLLAMAKMGLKTDEKSSDEEKFAAEAVNAVKIEGTSDIAVSISLPLEGVLKQLNDAPKKLGKLL